MLHTGALVPHTYAKCKLRGIEQSTSQVHWLSQVAWPQLSMGASDGCCWLHTAPCCGASNKLQPHAQVASFAIVSGQFFRLLNEIFTSECETCRGSGRIICKHCRGSKTLRRRQGVFTIQRLQVVDRDPADMCAAAPCLCCTECIVCKRSLTPSRGHPDCAQGPQDGKATCGGLTQKSCYMCPGVF